MIINGINAPDLIAQLPSSEVIVTDKGYGSERISKHIDARSAHSVIMRKRNSIKGNADPGRILYRKQHMIENVFARLKHYRAVAS